ncbi:MAG: protein kinase [Cyanobacteria bacterium HKST-UBA02]|nr:protein kinase [Cyanobacteria bacterium HKST-UBA02]
MKEEVCKICGSPKSEEGSGSLTQWLSRCRCVEPGTTDDEMETSMEEQQVSVCRTCGKRQAQGRSGSLTQFIFRFDLCSCRAPLGSRDEEPPVAVEREVLIPTETEAEAPALELPADSFPIGRYRPLQRLGSGASGEVYKAYDLLLKKLVAVKMLRSLTEAQMVSFQEEARATSKLNHPGIVRLLDFDVTPGGAPYMVLDFVDGTVLSEYLEANGPLPWSVSCDIAIKLCEALSYAHGHKVLHRDIQPGNVILSWSAGVLSVHLIDFGLAKIIQDSEQQQISEGSPTLAGTPFYMSADTARGLPYDRRSEVYSLGCVIFEMLAGRPPFTGGSPLETLAMHAEQEPPDLGSLAVDESIPDWLRSVVDRCLAKDPDSRYASMEDMLSDLRVSSGQTREEPEYSQEKTQNSRTSRIFLPLVIALVLLAVAGVCLFSATRESGDLLPEREVEKPVIELKPSDLHNCYDPATRKLVARMLVDDENSAALSEFKDAMVIDLSMCSVSDKVFSCIKSPRLRVLKLSDTNVRTLENIDSLQSLEELYLGNTPVDNQSLQKLASLPNLKGLDLSRTEIDGGAKANILKLDGLASLDIRQTALSENDAEAIARAMPGCSVGFRELAPPPSPINQLELTALMQQKRFSEVIARMNRIIESIEKAQGKDAKILAYAYGILGQSYLLDGRKDPARVSLDRAIAICHRRGEEIWIIPALQARCSLAALDNSPAEQTRLARELCKAVDKRYGDSPELVINEANLANVLWATDHKQESMEHYRRVVEIAEGLESPSPTSVRLVTWSAQQLCLNSRAQKDPASAEKYARIAVNYWQKVSAGEASRNASAISDAYSMLASSLVDGGKIEEAIKAKETCVEIARSHNLKSLDKRSRELERLKKLR